MSDPQATDGAAHDETPSTDELEQPSTEKNPDEEPKQPAHDAEAPDHQAFGIGVVGQPQVDPDAGSH